MKRLTRYSWILLLVVLSVPAGFLTVLTEKPYTPKSEYLFILIAGTIACILVVGGLSLIPYYVLKRNHSDHALKRALQCYTFFALAMIAMASYKYPETMRKRDRYHFSLEYQPLFEELALEELETKKALLPCSIWKYREEISFCIANEIGSDDQLIGKLRAGKDPEDLFYNDPAIDKIKKHCIDLYN